MANLILYDAQCNFCTKCILFILKRDKKKQFLFADLKGKTAHSMRGLKLDQQALILIENFQEGEQIISNRSKAVFKICWKLGGVYKLIGWKYILPPILFDWAYNLIARNRRYLSTKKPRHPVALETDRFLQ